MKTFFASALVASIAIAAEEAASAAAGSGSASSVAVVDLNAQLEAALAEAGIAIDSAAMSISANDRAQMCHSTPVEGFYVPNSYWSACVGGGELDACRDICERWCHNSWYLPSEGETACQRVMDAEPSGPSFEEQVEDIGRQVTDALQGLNVDVEGIARWVEEKAEELKDMEDRHEREVQDLKDEIAQEGEQLANQAAQAAASTIADRIRDFADQLEGGSGGDADEAVSDATTAGDDTASGEDTASGDAAAADWWPGDDTASGEDTASGDAAAADWWLQKQLEKERMRSRQTRIKNNLPRSMLSKEPWDLYNSCHVDNNLVDCREICTNGWSDDWFVAEEIADSCGLCVDRPTNDQIYNACVEDLRPEACSFTCYYGPRDPWFYQSEIMQGCLVIGFSKGGMDLRDTRDAFERVAGWWQEQESRHKEEDETLAMETFLEVGPHAQDAVHVVGEMIIDSVWDRTDSIVDAMYEQTERDTEMLQDVMDDLAFQIQEALNAVESELNGGGEMDQPDEALPVPVDPTPVDPTPVDPTPVDPTPVDPTPVPMSLASKGMTVQESSSNAAYYCAGATLVGAAAVAFCLLKKKESKENQTPFLSSDDDYLTAKL